MYPRSLLWVSILRDSSQAIKYIEEGRMSRTDDGGMLIVVKSGAAPRQHSATAIARKTRLSRQTFAREPR